MFAVIQIGAFPLHAALRFNPSLRGMPVAMLDGEGRRARISYKSEEATNVLPGMTAAQALAECSSLQIIPASLVAEREAGAFLLTVGWSIAPRVEASGQGWATVDLNGVDLDQLRKRLPEIRARLALEGLPAQIGVASNPVLARYAAHEANPECWVEDSRAFLATLPIDLLNLSENEHRLLRDLGLKTCGSITRFSRAAFTSRLGARGDELWEKAAGSFFRPIHPASPPTRHRASLDLEEPIEVLEPLLFVLRRFCDRLVAEVGQFGGAASRLSLHLRLDDDKDLSRDFELPEPTANPSLVFSVLENHLSSIRTEAPIVGVGLEIHPDRRRETQEGLFDTGLKDAPMFYATLGRLAAVVGAERVGTPRRADTHRPDSICLATPAVIVPERRPPSAPPAAGPMLRRFRPPVSATVELTEAKPSYLSSNVVHGEVRVLRRPVWTSGDWWAAAWTCEEWDVRIGEGLYRLLHDPSGWFVQGVYD